MNIEKKDTNSIVKKDNRLIRAHMRKMSNADAGRILAVLIAQIRKDDKQFRDIYEISIIDIISFIQDGPQGGSQYKAIKKACRALGDATYELEEKDEKGKKIYHKWPFFEGIHYKEGCGCIIAEFNPKLAKFLLNLDGGFTEYSLKDYMVLDSAYTQRIFEILSSWQNSGEVTITLEELYMELDIPNSLKKYKEFHRRVLSPAAEKINTKTRMRYEWEPIRKQRSVWAIRFIFAKRGKDKKAKGEKVKTLSEKLVKRTLVHQQTGCSASRSDVAMVGEGIMAQEKESTENPNTRKTFSVLFDFAKEEKE